MTEIQTQQVHFVLVGTTHSGNIGAAARAMKTMGFHSLRLVAPCVYKTQEAFARASGADGIVEEAQRFDELADAVADCSRVFGTSARKRTLEWSDMSLREAAGTIAANTRDQVAVVFGRERSGLTNEELDLCSHRLQIPTSAEFASLNLGSAVQVVAYELRQSLLAVQATAPTLGNDAIEDADEFMADGRSMERFYTHLEDTLVDLEFLDPENPRLLMRRLRRYFSRNRPMDSELNILRGILAAAGKAAESSPSSKRSGSKRGS